MKNILLAVFILLGTSLAAQRVFTWGVVTGFEAQQLGIQSIFNGEPDQMRAETKQRARGGSIGVFGRWPIWRGLSLRPGISLSTLDEVIHFYPEALTERYRFTDLELPLHFVLTNENSRLPLRGSLFLGGRVSWNFAAQHSENLGLLRERLALDIGLGVEISLKKWRLQPEFVYSHGLNNLHNVTNAKYDWVVGRIVRDRLTLRVLFFRE